MTTISNGYLGGTGSGFAQADFSTPFYKELWAMDIIRELDQKFVMGNCVKRQYIDMLTRQGDTVHLPRIGRMSVNTKAPLTPVTLQSRTEEEYTFTVDQYKEVSFLVEDFAELFTSYALRSGYVREAIYALAKDFDNYLLGLRTDILNFNNGSQVIYNTSDGTATGTKLAFSESAFLAAKQIMDEAFIPEEGRKLIVSPGVHNDLLTIDRYSNRDFTSMQPVDTGVVGQMYGVPVVVTNNLLVNSTTGLVDPLSGDTSPTPGMQNSNYLPTQFQSTPPFDFLDEGFVTCMMVHEDWAVYGMPQSVKTETCRETLYLADAVVTSTVYGAKTFRRDHCVLINVAP